MNPRTLFLLAMPCLALATTPHAAAASTFPSYSEPGDTMQPVVIVAPRITARDLQIKVAAKLDVRPLRYSADQAFARRLQGEFAALQRDFSWMAAPAAKPASSQ